MINPNNNEPEKKCSFYVETKFQPKQFLTSKLGI